MKIAILLLPEALNSTITGPADVIFAASLISNKSWEIDIVSKSAVPVKCFNGIFITPSNIIKSNDIYDYVIIPSLIISQNGLLDDYTDYLAWLLWQSENRAKIASICTGAFLLAQTGLLNGKKATTHWSFTESFRKKYPDIELDGKATLVDNGSTLCCAAGSAWQDLILHILQQNMNNSDVLSISETYQLQRHNLGQQSFCGLPEGLITDRAIEKSIQCLKSNYSGENALEAAIQASKLTPRTFQRRFKAYSGKSPAHYLQLLRVERAKEILTFEHKPIEQICFDVGYEDTSYFRRLFKKQTGMSMREYRSRYSIDPTRPVK